MANHLVPCAAIVAAVVLLMPCATGYPWPFCHDSDNFKANSSYQAHLDFVAATLPMNASASPDLFATAVVGTVPEQLWAVGLCRGDVNATACFNCLTQAFRDLQNDCSYDKGATIYYDPCMLHYSDNQQLLADDESDLPYFISYNGNVTSDQARFNGLVAELVNATAEHAAYNSTRRFATGESRAGFEPKVYSLAQCTPDLTAARCRTCLEAIISQSLDGFQNLVGGRALWINCTYRYETAPFFDGPAMVQIAPPPSSGAPAPAPTVAPSMQPTSGTPAAVAGGGEFLSVRQTVSTETYVCRTHLIACIRQSTGGRKYSRLPSVVVAAVLAAVTALNLAACLCFWRRRRRTAEEKQTCI
jgi:hypothetical protein